jgi:hypothetical protein
MLTAPLLQLQSTSTRCHAILQASSGRQAKRQCLQTPPEDNQGITTTHANHRNKPTNTAQMPEEIQFS